MNGLIAWFARNDVAANLLMLVIVVAGLYSLSNKIPIDLFPEFEINTVQVSTVLPGASPQEVEKGLTYSSMFDDNVNDMFKVAK